jgi:protein Mpv17
VWRHRYLDFGGAWWATGFKVLADQTVWSLYLNAMYSFFIGTLAFRKPGDVWADIKSTSWPALKVSWRFWPFVHCISFSHAVPLDLKVRRMPHAAPRTPCASAASFSQPPVRA